MKVLLDLTALVERGELTPAEAARLGALAAHDTKALGINILGGFGIVAVAGGAAALLPSALTAVVLGAMIGLLGFALLYAPATTWDLLARICVVIGALAFCGGVAALDEGSLRATAMGALVLAIAGVIARSGLLIAAAVLIVGGCLGASTDYTHAMYALTVEEPTLTIAVFTLIALAAYLVSTRVAADLERLALIAARTAVFMINFGFWIGSLWGDDLARLRAWGHHRDGATVGDAVAAIPASAFAIGWALALVAAGVWALRVNRRWLVNTVAVFAGIHFYTQWFDRLGADPLAVLGGGVLMLVFALGLWAFNKRQFATA